MRSASCSGEAEDREGSAGVTRIAATAGGDVLRAVKSQGADREVAPGRHSAGCAVGPPPRTRSGRGRRPARAALLVAGSTAAIEDVAGQAAKAVENLQTALADAGAELYDVISTRVLVASNRQEDLVTAWEVVRDAFGDHDVPSTLMGVTVLGYHDQLVEIEAVARRPRFLKRRRKRAARAR